MKIPTPSLRRFATLLNSSPISVIPAQADPEGRRSQISLSTASIAATEIPACAGMTEQVVDKTRHTRNQSFRRAQSGSATPFIALGIFMLVGATGTAIDMGRLQIVQSRLQNALDAAGLAAGSEISTTNLNTEVSKYFYANFPANYMGATVTSLTATPNADNSIFTLNAQGTLNTTFMKIFGVGPMAIAATSQITRASKGMELVLVLDNTGSMNNAVNPSNSSTSKIQAVKNAVAGSGGLLDILYGSSSNTAKNLWVGIVPFSQTVNIGTATSWTNSNSYDWGNPSHPWAGCVMARSAPYDTSDDIPSTRMFDAYYFATTGTVTTPTSGAGVSGNCSGGLDAWKCTSSSTRNRVTTNTLQYDFSYYSGLGTNKGPNVLCPQQVQPMVAEKATIVSAVNSMVAGGSTFIDLGMSWGQRMLSPKWRNLWGGEMNTNNLPLDYNTQLMNKVVVLMTDGMNEFDSGNFTAYGYLSDGQLGTTRSIYSGNNYSGSAEQALDNRTTSICSALKANGVIIYTIGFGTDDTDNINSSTSVNGTLLKACASKPEYYFLAPTNAQLQTAFQMIGDSLANLRISQ